MRNLLLGLFALAATPAAADWTETLEAAKGQTVYWHAWGGDERTNNFIAWVGTQTEEKFGVSVQQVKLSDTAEAVTRVLSEKAAGNTDDGAVDLIWINGPNFLSMKEQGLLHGPFVGDLPNVSLLDMSDGSAASTDFTVPTDGMESPWRLAKFVFVYDSARVQNPPKDIQDFLAWSAANPGRFTHPNPSNFMGATFLKQALIELTPDPSALQNAPTDQNFAPVTAPLWAWYDALRPNLWREGKAFPENESVQQQLLSDGEVDISMSFDPASTAAAIRQGLLPETARVFVSEKGSIGNISFVAIPFNAANKEGAKVVANFLLEPTTQAYMQNIDVLGSYAVLDPSKLDATAAAAFDSLPSDPALPTLSDLGATLPEPHPEWMTRIAEEWANRYAQ